MTRPLLHRERGRVPPVPRLWGPGRLQALSRASAVRPTAGGWGPGLILLAAAIATAPILLHGPFCGDDFEFHAVGWFDVQQSWLHGVAYPHWMASANYGAGEARFMFYPPLTWMLGAALGFVLPWALVPVAMVFLFLAGSGLAVRRLAQERLADAPATLAGCAAIFSGFALFTAYERTAFAELTGGFWIPLILLFALRPESQETQETQEKQEKTSRARILKGIFNGSAAALALLLTGAWLSNGPVGVMASYLLAGLAVGAAIWTRSWTPLLRASLAAALGIGLAGYSLIPAAWEQRWVDLRAAVDYPVFSVENNWLFARHTDPLLAPFETVLWRASWIAVTMIGVALAGAAVVLWRQIRLRQEMSGQHEAARKQRATGPYQVSGQHEVLGKHEVPGHDFSRAAEAAKTTRASAPEDQSAPTSRAGSVGRWWVFLALIPAVVLFLQLPISLPVWNLLPKLRFLQYPWRWLLAVEAPMGIFFAAAVWPARARRNWPRIAVACLCAGLFLGTTIFAARTFLRTCREGDSMADLLELFQGGGGVEGTDEYEPPGADHWQVAKGLPDACLSEDSDVVLGAPVSGSAEASQTPQWDASQGGCVKTFSAASRGPQQMRLAIDASRAGFLILRLMRYPAWRVTVNGKAATDLPERDDGLIAVPVPAGRLDLKVDWIATPDVLVGRWVSGLALGLLLWVVAIERQRRKDWSKIGKTLQTPPTETEGRAPAVAEEHVKG